jgi:SpoVK/Ycf46/Vps4 family AAA+-type ATPase
MAAARYRLSGEEVRAAVKLARTRAQLAGASAGELCNHLDAAAGAVARKSSVRFATVARARHAPEDLVLPPAVHEQVLEVAGFFRAWPHVADDWGFGRMSSGAGGIKALFTGDSGTGKTLAAEVIAGCLAMPLLKVDLSEIVSKWVGETEKHLETVFREAEASDAVLFFDEADALFGRRGEVQHGVDRYANLEVSYLLQRFEAHPGLVILASNLKDNIDPAFTRRFQITIHFPRPDLAQRRRIWALAFPPHAPLEESADLDALARLDLTGAGIVSAARTAALLAASEKRDVITKAHLARAIARQYHREARVLMPAELGPYAQLAQEGR